MEAPSRQLPKGYRFNSRVVVFVAVAILVILLWLCRLEENGLLWRRMSDAREVDLKALGDFQFDGKTGTIDDVPERFRRLDEKRIIVDGFATVQDIADAPKNEFQLVYNLYPSELHGPPRVQERIFAFLPKGMNVKIDDSPVRVTGKLHVAVKTEDGVVTSVYTMDVEKFEPRQVTSQ